MNARAAATSYCRSKLTKRCRNFQRCLVGGLAREQLGDRPERQSAFQNQQRQDQQGDAGSRQRPDYPPEEHVHGIIGLQWLALRAAGPVAASIAGWRQGSYGWTSTNPFGYRHHTAVTLAQCRLPSLSISVMNPAGMRGSSPSAGWLHRPQGAPAAPHPQA